MLRHLVTQWLRDQAQQVVSESLRGGPKAESADEQTERPSLCDVLLVFPNSSEAGGLVDKLANTEVNHCLGFVERLGHVNGCSVAIIETAAPHQQLALIVRDVVSLRQPKMILVCGFAAALRESLRRGQIVMATELLDGDHGVLSTGLRMEATSGVHVGGLLTCEKPKTIEAKQQLARVGVIACDSQAAVVGEVARVLDVPTMAIHVVAEEYSEQPSVRLQKLADQKSWAGALGAAAGALIDQPSWAKELWGSKERAILMSDRLAKFLVPVLKQFAPPS